MDRCVVSTLFFTSGSTQRLPITCHVFSSLKCPSRRHHTTLPIYPCTCADSAIHVGCKRKRKRKPDKKKIMIYGDYLSRSQQVTRGPAIRLCICVCVCAASAKGRLLNSLIFFFVLSKRWGRSGKRVALVYSTLIPRYLL